MRNTLKVLVSQLKIRKKIDFQRLIIYVMLNKKEINLKIDYCLSGVLLVFEPHS